jgi:hypothetical protein
VPHHSYVDLVVSLGDTVPIPDVVTLPATNVTGNSAQLNGQVTDNGFEDPNVTFYWGVSDGETTPENWDHTDVIGIQSPTFIYDVNSLLASTTYHFRAYAENSTGGAWADSTESFTTGSGVPIVLDAVSSDDDSSWSHTLGSGNNRIVVVGVGSENGGSFTGVTFDGVAMTLAPGSERGIDGNITAIFYMLEAELAGLPSPGPSYAVVVTTASGGNICGGAVSLENVIQAPPEAVATAAIGSNDNDYLSCDITTLTNGACVIDVIDSGNTVTFTADNPASTTTPLPTTQYELFDEMASSSAAAGSIRIVPTAGTVTNGWTSSNRKRRSMSMAAFAPIP